MHLNYTKVKFLSQIKKKNVLNTLLVKLEPHYAIPNIRSSLEIFLLEK